MTTDVPFTWVSCPKCRKDEHGWSRTWTITTVDQRVAGGDTKRIECSDCGYREEYVSGGPIPPWPITALVWLLIGIAMGVWL